jgi:hypothetical protein
LNIPELAGNDHKNDYQSAKDYSLGAGQLSSSSLGDESSQQCPDLGGQKGGRFSSSEDTLLLKFKGMDLTWTEIIKSFPGRSKDSFQTHYYTKLKRKDILGTDT